MFVVCYHKSNERTSWLVAYSVRLFRIKRELHTHTLAVAAGGNTLSRQRVNGCVRGLLRIRCCTPLVHPMKSLKLPLLSQINPGAHAARGIRCTQNNNTAVTALQQSTTQRASTHHGARETYTQPPLSDRFQSNTNHSRVHPCRWISPFSTSRWRKYKPKPHQS